MSARATHLLAWAGAAAVVLGCLAPVLGQWDRALPGPFAGIDPLLQMGILEWTAGHWHDLPAWYDLPIFYPLRGALGCMDSLLGQALLIAPLRALADPPAAALYNWAFLGSLLLAAAGMTALWKATGGRTAAAGCAVLALLGAPYTQSQLGHLNQLPPPMALLALAAAACALPRGREPAPPVLWWWLLAGALALQAAWGWYGFAYAAVGTAILAASRLPWTRAGWADLHGGPRRLLAAAGPPLVLAAAAVLLIAQPQLRLAAREPGFVRTLQDVRIGSADIQHLVNEGPYRRGLEDWTGRAPAPQERALGADFKVLSPGWAALLLAVYGWLGRGSLAPARRRDGVALLAVGAAGLILAFGDSVGLPGTERRLPLPLEWGRAVLPPLRAYREAWRFSWLFAVAIAWWSAVGCERLLAGRARAAAAAAMLLLAAVSVPAGVPAVQVPLRGRSGGVAAEPMGPVLTLPAPANEYAEDKVEALWIARAVEIGSPVTGGATGWVPPQVARFRLLLLDCERGAADPGALLRRARDEGMVRAEIALRPGDQARIDFWRAALAAHGATRQDPWPRDGYEMYVLAPAGGGP